MLVYRLDDARLKASPGAKACNGKQFQYGNGSITEGGDAVRSTDTTPPTVAITKTLKSTSVLRYKNYTYTWVGTDKEDSADKLKYRYRVYDGKFWNSWSAWSSNKVLSTSYKQEIQVNIQVKDSQGQIGESTNKVSLLDKATGVIASSSARAWQSLSWSNIKHFFAKDNKTDTANPDSNSNLAKAAAAIPMGTKGAIEIDKVLAEGSDIPIDNAICQIRKNKGTNDQSLFADYCRGALLSLDLYQMSQDIQAGWKYELNISAEYFEDKVISFAVANFSADTYEYNLGIIRLKQTDNALGLIRATVRTSNYNTDLDNSEFIGHIWAVSAQGDRLVFNMRYVFSTNISLEPGTWHLEMSVDGLGIINRDSLSTDIVVRPNTISETEFVLILDPATPRDIRMETKKFYPLRLQDLSYFDYNGYLLSQVEGVYVVDAISGKEITKFVYNGDSSWSAVSLSQGTYKLCVKKKNNQNDFVCGSAFNITASAGRYDRWFPDSAYPQLATVQTETINGITIEIADNEMVDLNAPENAKMKKHYDGQTKLIKWLREKYPCRLNKILFLKGYMGSSLIGVDGYAKEGSRGIVLRDVSWQFSYAFDIERDYYVLVHEYGHILQIDHFMNDQNFQNFFIAHGRNIMKDGKIIRRAPYDETATLSSKWRDFPLSEKTKSESGSSDGHAADNNLELFASDFTLFSGSNETKKLYDEYREKASKAVKGTQEYFMYALNYKYMRYVVRVPQLQNEVDPYPCGNVFEGRTLSMDDDIFGRFLECPAVSVVGKVTSSSTRSTIDGVSIRFSLGNSILDTSTQNTPDKGTYKLSNIAVGNYRVELVKDGYQPKTTQANVRAGNNTINFTMDKITSGTTTAQTAKISGYVKKYSGATIVPTAGANIKIDNIGRTTSALNGSYLVTLSGNPL
ncbi:hypothetical protein COS38_00090, partial [Candidatus Berkelbacteria bacterium CG03_land_8_20_14_0_80_40_36]